MDLTCNTAIKVSMLHRTFTFGQPRGGGRDVSGRKQKGKRGNKMETHSYLMLFFTQFSLAWSKNFWRKCGALRAQSRPDQRGPGPGVVTTAPGPRPGMFGSFLITSLERSMAI